MRRLRRGIKIAALVTLLMMLRGETIPVPSYFDYQLGPIVGDHIFDYVGWEVKAILGKLKNEIVDRDFRFLNEQEREAIVKDYFSLIRRISDAESEINRIYSQGDIEGNERLESLEKEMNRLERRRLEIEDAVEAIIGQWIEEALSSENLATHIFAREVVFPPVESEFERPPLNLVVSPRDRIEIKREVSLQPTLLLNQMEGIEEEADRLGVSSLVVPLGGVGTYPTMILQNTSLDFTVSTIAHEWFHNYLFLRPLGWHYWDSHELRTINETAADIGAEEIRAIVCDRHYASGGECKGEEKREGEAKGGAKPEFDFNKEMRDIRLTVDELLAQGKIQEAEDFMEERRRFLITKGYYLRKLNQAYFAFYGSYADAPTSVSPIGGELKELRNRSSSLGEFIRTVAQMTSYEDLKEALRRTGHPSRSSSSGSTEPSG